VPKSTLNNWAREVEKWVPGFRTTVLQGAKEDRVSSCPSVLVRPTFADCQGSIISDIVLTQKFDILITSYEMCMREKSTLRKFSWEYIIIDEAHRIKNVDSLLSQIIRTFVSRGRLLITGTPLQNNLHELWALLNFILPDVFSSRQVLLSLSAEMWSDPVVRTLTLGSPTRTRRTLTLSSNNCTRSYVPSCSDESRPTSSTRYCQRRRSTSTSA
jgi:SNF2 family DNA or RNA helicase